METLRPLHQNSGTKNPENRHALATRRCGGLASPDLYRAHLHEEAAAQRLTAAAHQKKPTPAHACNAARFRCSFAVRSDTIFLARSLRAESQGLTRPPTRATPAGKGELSLRYADVRRLRCHRQTGTIRRLAAPTDARNYQVFPITGDKRRFHRSKRRIILTYLTRETIRHY